MSADLYYTPPSDTCFDEVKQKAIEIWKTFDDTYGYATGKIEKIKDIQNVSGNFMYMVAMFDSMNQLKLFISLSSESKKQIRERLIAGGTPPYNIFF